MAHTKDRWQRISEKAFQIYQARGGVDGRHVEDWVEAERVIDEEDAGGTTPEERDTVSQVPRGSRRRGKSATM